MRGKRRIVNTFIERITIDRIESDEKTIRIECVPLVEHLSPQIFVKKLLSSKTEKLSWWDSKQAKHEFMSMRLIRKKLGLRKGEHLEENMVFWKIQNSEGVEIVHATSQARQLSKNLYAKLVSLDTDSKAHLKKNEDNRR